MMMRIKDRELDRLDHQPITIYFATSLSRCYMYAYRGRILPRLISLFMYNALLTVHAPPRPQAIAYTEHEAKVHNMAEDMHELRQTNKKSTKIYLH